MSKHKIYERTKRFEGMKKYYLYDTYTGEVREAQKTITDKSNNVICIGEWQNRLGEFKSLPVEIYWAGNNIIIDSQVIINLAKIIEQLQKTKGRKK
jgi:hypothetical protein